MDANETNFLRCSGGENGGKFKLKGDFHVFQKRAFKLTTIGQNMF